MSEHRGAASPRASLACRAWSRRGRASCAETLGGGGDDGAVVRPVGFGETGVRRCPAGREAVCLLLRPQKRPPAWASSPAGACAWTGIFGSDNSPHFPWAGACVPETRCCRRNLETGNRLPTSERHSSPLSKVPFLKELTRGLSHPLLGS